MPIVRYQLTAAATGTTAAAAQLQVTNSGRIVGTMFRARISASGGGGAFLNCELAFNQVSSSFAETNNPIRTGAIASGVIAAATSQVGAVMGPFVPQNWRVTAGDTLSVNVTQIGSAPASALEQFEIWIDESA